ncbi:MAG: hypothetical protein ACREPL_00320 [Rhodanobacteraceae bacterium]
MSKNHPGFKNVAAGMAKRQGISPRPTEVDPLQTVANGSSRGSHRSRHCVKS